MKSEVKIRIYSNTLSQDKLDEAVNEMMNSMMNFYDVEGDFIEKEEHEQSQGTKQ